jgi:hypothetical protein
MDISSAVALAGSTVSLLTPLLQKAIEKGSEEFGKAGASFMLDLASKLRHRGAKEALSDWRAAPNDISAQGAFDMQLRKALVDDSALEVFLKDWVKENGGVEGVSGQVAEITGNGGVIVQNSGDKNNIRISK